MKAWVTGFIKKILIRAAAVSFLLTAVLAGFPCFSVQAAPGYEDVAGSSDMAASGEVGSYGMVPVYGRDIKNGTYVVETESSSSFFRILEAKLTVQDGEMTAVLTMSSSSYPYVYPGTAEEAAKAPLSSYIPLQDDGTRFTFTVPVEALNKPLQCAAFSKRRKKWYGRRILFLASDLPPGTLSFSLPDYKRIEEALELYDEVNGTNSFPEEEDPDADHPGEEEAPEPVDMEMEDGEFSIEVSLTGGSGRASVTSPTWLIVKDGKGYARLLWSSSYYDYMIVGDKTYYNETTDGSNSSFTIPITELNTPMKVIADTTAMGEPLAIEYMLTFYADTVGSKGRVPQEAAKKVFGIALVIIIGGGILNHYVQKKRRQ